MIKVSWRARRAVLGLRQKDVGDRAFISQARYSQLERGEAEPTERERQAVEEILKGAEDVVHP